MNTTENQNKPPVNGWDGFESAGAGLVSLLLCDDESMSATTQSNTGLPPPQESSYSEFASDFGYLSNQGSWRVSSSSGRPPSQRLDTKMNIMKSTPELTATHRERHYVQHDYHDYSMMTPQVVEQFLEENKRMKDIEDAFCNSGRKKRGGITETFPVKLHKLLDQIEGTELSSIVSWQPHGRAFIVHNQFRFVEEILAKYFRQSKLTSFQRQLNLYGFFRITRGMDAGSYYNEKFLRGKPYLAKLVVRTRVKGTGFKASSNPEQEPKFYDMPFVGVDQHSPQENHFLPLNTPALQTAPPVAESGYMAHNPCLHTAPARSCRTKALLNDVLSKNRGAFYDQNFQSAPDSKNDFYLDDHRVKRDRRNALGYAHQWQSLAVPQQQQRRESSLVVDDPFRPNPVCIEEQLHEKDITYLASALISGSCDVLAPTPINKAYPGRDYNPYNY
mmetsp:Transcript_27951/g.43422  ORF Transcript_27951/g.43422 Transcript_27951/m.43422 type:complete len:445 (-) Transcript_27951:254-1588(-)